jgi:hypothetical protein
MKQNTIIAGQLYYDNRYADFFTLSAPIPPVNDDIEVSADDFKEYILSDWYRDNADRFIMTYNKGRIDSCRINWIEHHINGGQYILQ